MTFNREKITAAFDISDHLIRLVVVSGGRDGIALRVIDSVQLSAEDEKTIGRQLRSLILKHKLTGALVLASFPRHLVTVRGVRLPTAKEEEIRSMAELQAIKYLPYSQREIVAAHKTIDVAADGYTRTLIIVAQRKSVDKYIDIFKYAGVAVDRMAFSAEGALNWYSTGDIDDRQPVGAIDFDRGRVSVLVIKGKKLLFSRSISFDNSDPSSGKSALIREITLSFDSYLKDYSEAISRVILSGVEGYADNFSNILSERLSVPVEYAGQSSNIAVKDVAASAEMEFKKASYTHLLGMASRPEQLTVDLFPRDVIEKRKEKAFRGELIAAAALLLCVVTAAFGIVEKKITKKRSRLKKIEERLKKIDPEARRLSGIRDKCELISDQLAFRGSAIDIIREIYAILPPEVSLTILEFEYKNRVLLRGTTEELSTALKLLPLLERSAYFENVKINYAAKRAFKRREFADFEIVCDLRY